MNKQLPLIYNTFSTAEEEINKAGGIKFCRESSFKTFLIN